MAFEEANDAIFADIRVLTMSRRILCTHIKKTITHTHTYTHTYAGAHTRTHLLVNATALGLAYPAARGIGAIPVCQL